EDNQIVLVEQIPLKQLVTYNSIVPVIALLFLCHSNLEILKIIGPRCGDKIEEIFELIFESCSNIVDFSIGLITCTLDYLEIPWIPSLQYLMLNYKDEINLDDLYRFFGNINSRSSSVLLEIVIPYNAQVVSKSIQFDEFGKPKKN
ncbi:25403_t:CDS:2, partial [Gigaspora rosea]